MKILLSPDAGNGAGPAKAGTPNQAEQLKAALAEIAALKASKAETDADEELIAQKTSVGLTRQQAIAVIKHQREFDVAQAKRKAEREAKAEAKAEREAKAKAKAETK